MSDIVDIELLGKSYQLKCPEENAALLKKAGKQLDGRLNQIRDSGVIGTDRIAMMAALNICYEMLNKNGSSSENGNITPTLAKKIQSFCNKIDTVTKQSS